MNDLIILMPVYNDQEDMIKTLSSINEENNDFEVLIVDDGSAPPLSLNNNQFDFKVTIYRLEHNKGITKALNAGLELISKRNDIHYIARLDAGDIQVYNRLHKQREYLKNNIQTMMVGSNVNFYNVKGEHLFSTNLPLTNKDIKKEKYIRSCFIHPTVIFSKKIIDEGLRYSNKYPCAEDYEFFLRIINKYNVANLADNLLFCHDRINGISIKRRKKQINSVLKTLLAHKNIYSLYWYIGFIKVLAQYVIPKSFFSYVKARIL